MPALKRLIFRKAAAAAVLSVAVGAGGLITAAPASAAVCPPGQQCVVGKSTVYVKAGTVLRANKYGWPKGANLRYRWYQNGHYVAGGWNSTHAAWGPKGTKWVVRVHNSKDDPTIFKISRTFIVR